MKPDFKVDMMVLGQRIQYDFGEQLAIFDLSQEMDEVAVWIGYVAELWGMAEEEKVRVDGEYRHWYARKAAVMLDDPKSSAEHKIKFRVESDPKFREWKAAIGRTEYNVTTLKGVFNAFQAKGNQLQSRGARERAELEKTGMRTMERPPEVKRPSRVEVETDAEPEPPAASTSTPEEKKNRMRELNAKKKTNLVIR